jgi:hypothetical protein
MYTFTANLTECPDQLPSFLNLPFVTEIPPDSPLILLGDFNLQLHDPTATRHIAVIPLVDWLSTNFINCFPEANCYNIQNRDRKREYFLRLCFISR